MLFYFETAKQLKEVPFGAKQKFREKSRTVPKKFQRGPFRIIRRKFYNQEDLLETKKSLEKNALRRKKSKGGTLQTHPPNNQRYIRIVL